MKKVLYIEDNSNMVDFAFITAKIHGIELHVAMSKREAIQKFSNEFDAIIFDGRIEVGDHAGEPDSLELIRLFQNSGYAGKMIAVATRDEDRIKQLQAGCSMSVEKFGLEKLFGDLAKS